MSDRRQRERAMLRAHASRAHRPHGVPQDSEPEARSQPSQAPRRARNRGGGAAAGLTPRRQAQSRAGCLSGADATLLQLTSDSAHRSVFPGATATATAPPN